MHELSLTRPIVDITLEKAIESGAAAISKVVIEIGVLAAIDRHAVELCFQVLTQDTLAQGAELVVIERACEGECRECGATFEVPEYYYACPNCQSFDIERNGGDEFILKEIEIN